MSAVARTSEPLPRPGRDAEAGLRRVPRRGRVLANSPGNLVRWIMDPPAVDSATAMPAPDVSEAEARDIAAYLYALE